MALSKSERASLLGQALIPQLNSRIRPGEESSPEDLARQQNAVDRLAADIVEAWDADPSDPLYDVSENIIHNADGTVSKCVLGGNSLFEVVDGPTKTEWFDTDGVHHYASAGELEAALPSTVPGASTLFFVSVPQSDKSEA